MMFQERNQNVIPVQYSAMQLQPAGASIAARVVAPRSSAPLPTTTTAHSSSRLSPLDRGQTKSSVADKLREIEQLHDNHMARGALVPPSSSSSSGKEAADAAPPPQVRVAHGNSSSGNGETGSEQQRGAGGASAVVPHDPQPQHQALPQSAGSRQPSMSRADAPGSPPEFEIDRRSASSEGGDVYGDMDVDGDGIHPSAPAQRPDDDDVLEGVPPSETSTPHERNGGGNGRDPYDDASEQVVDTNTSPFSPHRRQMSPDTRRTLMEQQQLANNASDGGDDDRTNLSALTPMNRSLEPPEELVMRASGDGRTAIGGAAHGGEEAGDQQLQSFQRRRSAFQQLDDDDRMDSPLSRQSRRPSVGPRSLSGSTIMAHPLSPSSPQGNTAAVDAPDSRVPQQSLDHPPARPPMAAAAPPSPLTITTSSNATVLPMRSLAMSKQKLVRDQEMRRDGVGKPQRPNVGDDDEDAGGAAAASRWQSPPETTTEHIPSKNTTTTTTSSRTASHDADPMVAAQLQRAMDMDAQARHRYEEAVHIERAAMKREQELLQRQAAQDARELDLNKQLLSQQALRLSLEQQQKAVDAARKTLRNDLQLLASHAKRLHALTLQSRCAAIAASSNSDVVERHHSSPPRSSSPQKAQPTSDASPSSPQRASIRSDNTAATRLDDQMPLWITVLPMAFTTVGLLIAVIGALLMAWR